MTNAGETTLHRRRGLDAAIALLLMAATVAWMLAVEGRQGIGRDEGQYFRAAERYWGWFERLGDNIKVGRFAATFSDATIEEFWGDNPEHPALMKTLYGVSWRFLHRCDCPAEAHLHPLAVRGKHVTLPLFKRESTAFRFPAFLMAGLGAALVYLLARRWIGRVTAVAAAVMSVAQPHYFFHAQLAAFDAPITVMAVAVGYAYWRSLRSARWGVLAGVIFGLALGVKHNAWLMPIFLVGHYLWMRRQDLRRFRPPRVPLVFVSMAVLGPLVFYLHWPKVWANPVGHTRWYVNRHVQHEHYHFEYLDRNWNNPPKQWDRMLVRATFPFVSTAVTVPATTLVLAGIGGVLLFRRARRRRPDDDTLIAQPPPAQKGSWLRPGADCDRAPGAFLAVQILGPIAVLAIPSAPIFGGVKHFMPAMPYLAIVAGVGLRWLIQQALTFIRSARAQQAAPAALAAMVCLPSVLETRRSHPDGLAFYNYFAGGFAGGADLGMNRQFWGYSVLPLLDWLVPPVIPASRRTYWHDVMWDAMRMYLRDGRTPPGLGWLGDAEDVIDQSDIGLVIQERHFKLYEGRLWRAYGTTQPVRVYNREGVPIVNVYRRPGVP